MSDWQLQTSILEFLHKDRTVPYGTGTVRYGTVRYDFGVLVREQLDLLGVSWAKFDLRETSHRVGFERSLEIFLASSAQGLSQSRRLFGIKAEDQ